MTRFSANSLGPSGQDFPFILNGDVWQAPADSLGAIRSILDPTVDGLNHSYGHLALTANKNNWDIWAATTVDFGTSGMAVISINTNGAYNVTGFAPAGRASSRLYLFNESTSAGNITFKHEVTSTNVARIWCPGLADIVIPPGYGILFVYGTALAAGNTVRWIVSSTNIPNGERSIILAADQTRAANTATYVDIPTLTVALPTGLTVVSFVLEGWYQSNTATCGINIACNAGGGTPRYLRRIMTTSPATYDDQNLVAFDGGAATTAVDTINTDRYFRMAGKIIAPTGTLAMRYSNEVAVAGNSVKIMTGTTLTLYML